MTRPRQTSAVILVTLAELAWLAAFGLLIAYRGKITETNALHRRVAKLGSMATNATAIVDEREQARKEASYLRARLDAVNKSVGGRTDDEAVQLLTAAINAGERTFESERKGFELGRELGRVRGELEIAKSRLKLVPSNALELRRLYLDATNDLVLMKARLTEAYAKVANLTSRVGQLELGEIAIRRDLIGLPATSLRRVVFIVDTSSSMRNSPAWQDARLLMRMWIAHLAVEECALVSFNDKASTFPKDGYQRVRDADGRILVEPMADLLRSFDRVSPGTFSDLLKGLRAAYRLPNPDLIVLLTDGHPHVATQGDKAFGSAILREAALHPKIPILTVAVGDYEVEGAGGPGERRNAAISFLKALAKATEGGSFIAR